MADTKLSADQCREKAAECLKMAALARDTTHKVMLEHMAETWERICEALKRTANRLPPR